HRRAGANGLPVGPGLPAVHRADARRRPRGHHGHRAGGRGQRGPAGRRDPRAPRSGPGPAPPGAAGSAGRPGAGVGGLPLMSRAARAVKPPATIGILGSGQLGRMSAMAAKTMGYRVVVLGPERGSPAGQVSDRELVAPYTDPDALDALAREAHVVTYEFENVPAATAARLEARGIVHPSSRILHLSQNRIREKEALRQLGLPVTAFAPVDDADQLRAAAEELGYPCVLKTAEGGYDGKGQVVLRGPEDVAARRADIDAALAGPPPAGGGARCILEAFVPFERELSVIVARNGQGQCASFPVAENVHVDNILHRTTA